MEFSHDSEENTPTPPAAVTTAWSRKISEYVQSLKITAAEKSEMHNLAGHHFRALEIYWGIPSVLLPVIFSPLVLIAGYVSDDTCERVTIADYVAATGLMSSGLVNAVCSFFKYGNRTAMHQLYSAKYSDIITDIDAELIKTAQYRINAEQFITAIKMKYDNLVFGEPLIPLKIEIQITKKFRD
jgi:hypothetical protein